MHKTLVFALAPLGGLLQDFSRAGIKLSDFTVIPIGLGVDETWDAKFRLNCDANNEVTRTQFDAIANVVQQEWIDWRDKDSNEFIRQYFSYLFYITRTPLVHWRMTVELALEEYKPDEVFVYGLEGDTRNRISNRDELLLWAREAIVREASPNVKKVEASERQSAQIRFGILPLRIDALLDYLWHFEKRISNLFARFSAQAVSCLNFRERFWETSSPRFVVLAQERNASKLLTILKIRGIRFTKLINTDHMKLSKDFSPKILRETSETLSPGIVDDYFYKLLDFLVSELLADEQAIIKFASQQWQVLMTDHEHDPHVRLLTDKANELGKSIVFIPEGVQSLTSPSVRPYFWNWFWDVPWVTRFTVDEQEADHYLDTFRTNKVVVTGYLGDPVIQNLRLSGRLLASITRVLLRKHHGSKPMALINFEDMGVLGLARAGQQDLYSEIASVESLICALTEKGWSVCVTSKVSHSFKYLRSRFKRHPVWFFANVNWQILGKASDVLIQRDSSIGVEALELNIPVIIWNDCGLPLASVTGSESEHGLKKLVLSTDELEEALKGISILARNISGCTQSGDNLRDERIDLWLRAHPIGNL